MAHRFRVPRNIRRAITKTLRFLRIRTSVEEKASMEARPDLKMDPLSMSLKGVSKEMAEEFADDLKRIISRQLLAWVPLSSGYAKKKRMLGLDPRILIATGRYVESISPVENPDGSWVVAVPAEPLQSRSKYTLKDLARWLEYGTRNMPARPHWRPAMQLWRTKIYQVRRRVRHDITQEMKKAGFR